MNRLTRHDADLGYYVYDDYAHEEVWKISKTGEYVGVVQGDAITTLAAYEDFFDQYGTPDKITAALSRLAEYDAAEREGRLVRLPETGIGNLSDGYHTFNELYHHRAILFSTICHHAPDIAWKSKKHDDGTMYDGMFIVGLDTPVGSATYHYDIEPYWEMFRVKELDRAPKWDGHTPTDAINRIFKLGSMYADVTQWTAEIRAEAEKGKGE